MIPVKDIKLFKQSILNGELSVVELNCDKCNRTSIIQMQHPSFCTDLRIAYTMKNNICNLIFICEYCITQNNPHKLKLNIIKELGLFNA